MATFDDVIRGVIDEASTFGKNIKQYKIHGKHKFH